jgi:predicted tellurium resistance membrane protein TerC
MDVLLNPDIWLALLTLTALEIVLGVDNIIFLSIVVAKLPKEQQSRARTFGLAGAYVTRVGLLLSLAWLASLTKPLFSAFAHDISSRDLVLILGGLFLLYKSVVEIHESVEGAHEETGKSGKIVAGFWSAIIQIMILDIVFSLDSVITAIGMTNHVPVMVTAITIAIIVMMFFAGPLSAFVDRHPTVKMLALSFLIMIGGALIAEGIGVHVPKGYIYFAMAFSVSVEMLNLRLKKSLSRRRIGEMFDE